MAIHTANAVILRRWNFRETSLIVSFFTDGAGKFHGLIKGFYDRPPRYGPAMPGSLNAVVFYESARRQLLLVSQCDLLDPLASSVSETSRLHAQSRVLELLEQGTMERDPHPELFQLARQVLPQLARVADPDGLVRFFEIKYLKLLGLSPSVDDCVSCGVPACAVPGLPAFAGQAGTADRDAAGRAADAQPALSLKHGGLLCRRCAGKDALAKPLLPGTLATLQHALVNPWDVVLRLQWTSPVRQELGCLLDRFIAFYIEARFKTRRPVTEWAHAKT